jgi:hypothetical protein
MMYEHPAARSAAALTKIMEDMQWFLENPPTQQEQWVANIRTWLPVLQYAKDDLLAESNRYTFVAEAYQVVWDTLGRVGLQVHQLDLNAWAYSWHGGSPVGNYPSRAQALEAALRERLPREGASR